MDRQYVFSALGYAIIGMLLGIFMAASKDHSQHVTHAHILLLGFVVSFIYGLCFKLWLRCDQSSLAHVQFYLHQVGTACLSIGLFLLYSGSFQSELLDPVLAISSILILASMILMKVLFIKNKTPAVTNEAS